MTTPGSRVFLARLAGTGGFDPNADQVGRVRDVVVTLSTGSQPARAIGLVVEVQPRRRIFVPMTKVQSMGADQVIVTSDNPRTEDPQQILADVVAGIPADTNLTVDVDRGSTIANAIAAAASDDLVLIAGKGHEDYQILGTTKIHFDDREEAEKALRARLN